MAIPRRYAVLARQPTGWLLKQAILNSERHQLVEPRLTDVRVSPEDTWKLLIEQSEVDAILVDADDALTLASARELAIRGKPLVVRVRPTLPPEFVAEMSLYAAEGATSVIPWFDHRHGTNGHHQWDCLRRWIDAAPVGQMMSIHLERELLGDDEFRSDRFLTGVLLTDLDMLRMIGGDYSQVTLIRTGSGAESFTAQTLQLAGSGRPDATCTYRKSDTPSGLRLRIDGTETCAEVLAEDDDLVWRVGGVEADRSRPPEFEDALRGAECERMLTRLETLWTRSGDAPQWSDLARIYDITEAMQRSLRRRRTIDLQFETTSERSQFKTHMATIGCGVILWTMLGVIGLLFAGAVLDPRDRMQREAEAAGFVVRAEDFEPGTAQLTEAGESQLAEIAGQLSLSDAVVIVAASDAEGASAIDEQRLQSVRQTLIDRGAADAETRVVLRPLKGTWFLRLMQIGRVLVFAPVGLYLLFQLLLIVAKPPAARSDSR